MRVTTVLATTSAAAGLVLAGVTPAMAAPAAHHVAPATSVRAFAIAHGVQITWRDPSSASFDRAVARYQAGRVAPAGPGDGTAIRLAGHRATSAMLPGLRRDHVYSVSVFAIDHAHRASSPASVTFTAGTTPHTPTARYTGRVTDRSGHPLRGVEVVALSTDDSNDTRQAVSAPDGEFGLRLPLGRWLIETGGGHITGGTSDDTGYVSTSRWVDVTTTHAVSAGRVALAPGGAVTVQVTDKQGRPASGAVVTLEPVSSYIPGDADFGFAFYGSLGNTPGSVTDASGDATVTGMPAGVAYRTCASPGNTQTVFAASAACSSQSVLAVPGATRAGPVVTLPAGPAPDTVLVGQVRTDAGHGLPGTLVGLIGKADRDDPALAVTTADGRFRATGLKPGSYQVCAVGGPFESFGATGYAGRCTRATVSTARPASLSLVLHPAAAVTGRVTGPAGKPVAGLAVQSGRLEAGAGTFTDSRGNYRLKGLTGSYRICFGSDDDPLQPTKALPTGVLPSCRASKLFVDSGHVRAGIDGHVSAAAAIRGVVRDSSGRPIPDAEVVVIKSTGRSGSDSGADFDTIDTAATDHDGRYVVPGLKSGRYRVCVGSAEASGAGQQKCLGQKVTADVGRTTHAPDVTLAATSAIRATVRDTAGHPLDGVDVVALKACSHGDECVTSPLFGSQKVTEAADVVTTGSGTAVLDGLTPGRYALCSFAYYAVAAHGSPATGYADRCTSSRFTVTVHPRTATGVVQTLGTAGAVAGQVTDSAGHPLAGVHVEITGSAAADSTFGGSFADLYNQTDDPAEVQGPASDAVTGADGRYLVRSVRPGTQTVCFDAAKATGGSSKGGYRNQCAGGAVGNAKKGRPVTVRAGAVTSGIDLALTSGAGLSGTITGPGHTGYSEVLVARGTDVVAAATAGPRGRFSVKQLAPSTDYRVCATNDVVGGCFRNVAWTDVNAAPPLAKATDVTAVAGGLTGGVNVVLRR